MLDRDCTHRHARLYRSRWGGIIKRCLSCGMLLQLSSMEAAEDPNELPEDPHALREDDE